MLEALFDVGSCGGWRKPMFIAVVASSCSVNTWICSSKLLSADGGITAWLSLVSDVSDGSAICCCASGCCGTGTGDTCNNSINNINAITSASLVEQSGCLLAFKHTQHQHHTATTPRSSLYPYVTIRDWHVTTERSAVCVICHIRKNRVG